MRAILVAAAEQEAARQAAQERGDWPGVWEAEREIQKLWRRYGEIERRVA
jgi:hypothetical protein